jgi:hypothetical protein
MKQVYIVFRSHNGQLEKLGFYMDRMKAEEVLLNAAFEILGSWVAIQIEAITDSEVKT